MGALCVTLLVCTLVMQASPIVNGTFNPSYPPFTVNKPASTSAVYFGGSSWAKPWVFSDASTHNRSGIVGNSPTNGWGFTPMNGASFNALLEGQSNISQTLALTQGDFYTLTFYLTARTYGNHQYAVDPVEVLIGGTMQTVTVKGVSTPTGVVTGGTQLGPTITLNKGQGWTQEKVTFTATGPSEVLTFQGMTAGGATDPYTGLDDVSARVPEPAMALLLPFGLLFVNGLRKRFLA
jgi:hypothetical protein